MASLSLRLLYSSLRTSHQRAMAERAVRGAIGNRAGEWFVSLVEPPRQRLLVVTLDGPKGFTHTWAFDEDDQLFHCIRHTIAQDLPSA